MDTGSRRMRPASPRHWARPKRCRLPRLARATAARRGPVGPRRSPVHPGCPRLLVPEQAPGYRRAPAARSSCRQERERNLGTTLASCCSSTSFFQGLVDELLERRERLRTAQVVAVDHERGGPADAGLLSSVLVRLDAGLVRPVVEGCLEL